MKVDPFSVPDRPTNPPEPEADEPEFDKEKYYEEKYNDDKES